MRCLLRSSTSTGWKLPKPVWRVMNSCSMPLSSKRLRSSRVKRLFWLVLGLGVIAAVLLAGYMLYLDRTITKVFDGRRWSVPARVYAAPLELYPGSRLKQGAFVAELERVGYVRAMSTRNPGTYRPDGNTVRVHLRPFQFHDRRRDAEVVDIRFRSHGITDIARPHIATFIAIGRPATCTGSSVITNTLLLNVMGTLVEVTPADASLRALPTRGALLSFLPRSRASFFVFLSLLVASSHQKTKKIEDY